MTIPPFIDGEILYGAQLDAVVAEVNNKLSLDGGTVSGLTTYNAGLSLGSTLAATTKDLSKHLAMFGSIYGMNVTSSTINVVVNGNVNNFFSTSGFYGPIGTNAPNTARFTTLEATGTVSGAGFTTLLAPYLKDAPNDANVYGRKGGAWSVVGGGAPSDTAPLMDGVAAAGSLTTYSRGDHKHPTDTTRAPLADPVFTGNPRAPTPLVGDNDTSIATTEFVFKAVEPIGTELSNLSQDLDFVSTELFAHTANKSNPHATTAAQVGALPIGGGTLTGPLTLAGNAAANLGAVTLQQMNAAIAGVSGGGGGTPSDTLPVVNGVAAAGVLTTYSRGDHVHPTDTSRAPLVSPDFTGTPTAPLAAAGTNNTQIATTSFANRILSMIQINIGGGVDYTLSVGQAGYGMIYFYGTLTANISVIFPVVGSSIKTWQVMNVTSGAYTVTLRGTGGGTVPLRQGGRQQVWTDGGGMYFANTDSYTPAAGENSNAIATTGWTRNTFLPLAGGALTGPLTLAADGSAAMHAVTVQQINAKVAGYLPLTGGTLTGTLTVKGDVVVGSASDWFLTRQAETGDHISAHTPTGDYERWQASTGHRLWVANNEPIMFLDQLGNLNLDGALRSTSGVWASIADNSNGIYTSGGFKIWQVAADGWRQQFNATTHDWNFVNNTNTTVLSISATGTVNTAGDVTATGHGVFSAYLQGSLLYGPNGVFVGVAGDSSFGMYKDTGGYKQQYVPDYHWWFDTTNGSTYYSVTNAHAQLWFMRPSDLRSFNQAGPVGGNGAYENISDRRAKSAIEVSKDGLAEVMKLQPVQFTRVVKPRAEDATYPNGEPLPPLIPRREVGFIAQDVVSVLPHAVSVVGVELHDGSGTLEDKEPSLALTYDTITAALVNAVKEQQAMIDGLHARIKTLEGVTP